MKNRLLCAILGLAFGSVHALAQEPSKAPEPAVLFTGTSLPTPPAQGQPWKPPASKLSEKWISALEELVRHGFADPRGCEYREVKLTCGSELVTTHAWVMPEGQSEKNSTQRFAVTWDGLVYPVVKLGPTADLKADVEAVLAWAAPKDAKSATVFTDRIMLGGESLWAQTFDTEEHISYDSLLVLKSCLLCRLGEGSLAERFWMAWVQRSHVDEATARDPYLLFVKEWGWVLYKRAANAHRSGDDVICMTSAQTLVAMQEAVERIAPRRGFRHSTDRGCPEERELPYLDFKDSPVRLLEDATHRVRARPCQRVLELGLEKFPDQAKRIEALVRDLEVVQSGDLSSTGSYFSSRDVLVADSPIVKALVNEGPLAVEPLLACLASDRRLTRAVEYYGKFATDGCCLIGVDEAAFAALRGIIKVDNFGPITKDGYWTSSHNEPSPAERHAVTDEIRRFWERHQGGSKENVWIAVLANREAAPAQWLEVAEKIVAPVPLAPADAQQSPAGLLPGYESDDANRPLIGEVLRNKRNPSITELMDKRADDIVGSADLPDSDVADVLRTACDLTLCLAKWNHKAAIPAIRRRFVDYHAYAQSENGKQSFPTDLAKSMTLLAEAGIRASDDAVVNDYAAWIRTMPAKAADERTFSLFMPLWRHPENPKLTELARWAFLSAGSPWHPDHVGGCHWRGMWNSPLLAVSAFRQLLKQELANTMRIGTVTFDFDRDTMILEVPGIPGKIGTACSVGNASPYALDMELPKSREGSLRVCDDCAYSISELAGSPRIELYWPEKRRDAACAEIAAFFDRWGPCFRDSRNGISHDSLYSYRPRFSLPKLSQAATLEDVAAGRAIFSLRDQPDTQVRVVPLKPYPSIARWKTLKQFPLRKPGAMEWPKETDREGNDIWDNLPKEYFDREGYLWQAEEVLRDGKWRRYYGFVGTHIIAKVPAEEIEILDRFSPAHPNRY